MSTTARQRCLVPSIVSFPSFPDFRRELELSDCFHDPFFCVFQRLGFWCRLSGCQDSGTSDFRGSFTSPLEVDFPPFMLIFQPLAVEIRFV